MKAHEKIAETARLNYIYSKSKDSDGELILTSKDIKEHIRYGDFINEDEARKFIYKEDLVISFTEWLEQNPKA